MGGTSFTYDVLYCFEGLSFAYQLLYLLDATAFYSPSLHVLGLHVCRATGQELVYSHFLLNGLFVIFYADIVIT